MRTAIVLLLATALPLVAQRPMEFLDRAPVALERSNGVFLTWRMLGRDPADIAFNLYRNGQKINPTPITDRTNYLDAQGSAASRYRVETILIGADNELSEEVAVFPLSTVPDRPRVPLKRIPLPEAPVLEGATFTPGDMSVGDLDGDGSYELVFEWECDLGHSSHLEAIDLDGNSLWRMSAGPNVTTGKLNFMVYDLNEDGRAEVSFLTGPGTTDGTGAFISKGPASDYPSDLVIPRPSGRLMEDPQLITVFDGFTGAEMATTEHWPPLGPVAAHDDTWGDNYGHRASSLKGAVLYTREHGPILVYQRGVYTRIGLGGYKWDGADGLTRLWTFDTEDPEHPEYQGYRGQGNHTVSVGDLDGDGNDELIIGAAAIDDDGSGLYTTGRGHGDANHLGKHIPDRPGLQFFQPHENGVYGISMRDAGTGEILWEVLSSADVGRAWAADVDPTQRGSEVVAIGFPNYDCNGNELSSGFNAYNQPIYFDGEVQRGWRARGISIESYAHGRILTGWYYGADPIHGSKEDANLVADILGDWREEVVFKSSDNTELLLFSSWFPTERKNPTLMHDPTYRMNIATQNVGYNQPAHTGYYFADGYPESDIVYVTPSEAPRAPTGLTAVAGNGSVELDWADNYESDLAGYTVWRSTTGGSGYIAIATDVTASTYVDSTVTNGITYHYVVTALDSDTHESPNSEEASATPMNVILQPGSTDLICSADTSVYQRDGSGWTAINAGSSICMDVREGDGGSINFFAYINFDLSSLGDVTITNATLRLTRLDATTNPDEGGNSRFRDNSGWSDTLIDIYGLDDGPGGTAQNWSEGSLSFDTTGSEVDATSAKSTDPFKVAGGYSTDFSTLNSVSNGSSAVGTDETFLTGQSLVDWLNDRVDDGGLTTFMVDASSQVQTIAIFSKEGAAAAGDPSIAPTLMLEYVVAVPGDSTPPAAPTALVATSDDGSVTLDWADNADDDLKGYTVWRSTVSGSGHSAITANLSTSSFTDSTTANGTTYHYVVSAVDTSDNESAVSSEASATPSPPVTPEESRFSDLTVVGGSTLRLTVSDSVPGHRYALFASDTLDPSDWTEIDARSGDGSNFHFMVPIDPESERRFFRMGVSRR